MFTYISLFSGIGCSDLAVQQFLGWKPYCYVEKNEYRISVLTARIEDELLFDAPIWDDARTFDGTPWRGLTDCIIGSDECQGIPRSQSSGEHIDTPTEAFLRIVSEVQPRFVIRETPYKTRAESPSSADSFADWLEALDYSTTLLEIRASDMGADHRRTRIFVGASLVHAESNRSEDTRRAAHWFSTPCRPTRWTASPRICRSTDGVAYWNERLRALGVGSVPSVVTAVSAVLSGEGIVL